MLKPIKVWLLEFHIRRLMTFTSSNIKTPSFLIPSFHLRPSSGNGEQTLLLVSQCKYYLPQAHEEKPQYMPEELNDMEAEESQMTLRLRMQQDYVYILPELYS